MADEYINKQRAKDLLGCCLASAKANYKEETNIFKKTKFQCYVETIEAMIDVVGAVEAADVQPVNQWISVKDRLPEIGQKVLVYYPKWDGNEIQVAHLMRKRTFFYVDGINIRIENITHWQPLSKPPENE